MSTTPELDNRPIGQPILRCFVGTPLDMPKRIAPKPGDCVTLMIETNAIEVLVTSVTESTMSGMIEDIRDALDNEHHELRQRDNRIVVGESIDFQDAHIFRHSILDA